jgi:hypothetical protein
VFFRALKWSAKAPTSRIEFSLTPFGSAWIGSGGLAIIDARSREKLVEVGLKGHPEGFELETAGKRVFVNVP